MLNINPIDIARQKSERQGGGGNAQFFSLQEGESTILRFLTGMVPTYMVRHDCGLNTEMKKELFEEARVAGAAVSCPGCGQPLVEANIVGERDGVLVADVHNYFPTSDADKRTTFVCLASRSNAMFGHVPADADGNPMYQCPACSCQFNRNKDTGKPKAPGMRVYGVAVERVGITSTEMVNGIPTPVVKDVRDVMVEDGGKTHPKVVIVNMSYSNFWSKVQSFDPTYTASICNYDWRVTRIGSGLSTTYDVQPLDTMHPTMVDMSAYAEWMPDVAGLIKGMGDPEYYVKRGYAVPGYVSQGNEPQQTVAGAAAQAIQQAAFGQPAQQVSPQPMPQQIQQGGGSDWSFVQNQFS